MTAETISRVVEELVREYPGAASAFESQVTFVRLREVFYPDGCSPASSAALVVLDPQQPAPARVVEDRTRLSPSCLVVRMPSKASDRVGEGQAYSASRT